MSNDDQVANTRIAGATERTAATAPSERLRLRRRIRVRYCAALDRARGDTTSGKNSVAMKNHRVALGFMLLLGVLGGTLHGSLALAAIDRLAQSENEMDKIEIYRGFEIRAFEREEGRWRAEIRKADGSMLKILVGDSGHRTSITTSADTLTAETSIDEVKKAIDAGGLS